MVVFYRHVHPRRQIFFDAGVLYGIVVTPTSQDGSERFNAIYGTPVEGVCEERLWGVRRVTVWRMVGCSGGRGGVGWEGVILCWFWFIFTRIVDSRSRPWSRSKVMPGRKNKAYTCIERIFLALQNARIHRHILKKKKMLVTKPQTPVVLYRPVNVAQNCPR